MNDLVTIERHARALMTAHGVGSLDFHFDRGKRVLGQMHYQSFNKGTPREQRIAKGISLSKHYAAILPMEELDEVMRHEIAHAKTIHLDKGHGPVWKREARALGIKGDRCATPSDRPKDYTWEAFCPTCGEKRGAQFRAPLRVYGCSDDRCKALSFYDRALVWKKNGALVPAQDMPERFYAEWQRIMARKYAV